MEHPTHDKILSHYHLSYRKKYLHNEIQDKHSLCFCGLHTFTAFSVSNTHMIMTYSIISLLNIGFVKKRCRKMTISMNKGCKVGMTLFGDVVYCQNLNVTQNRTKMLHYTAGLSSCLVKRFTYISHRVFCIEYKQHTTIISMSMVYKKNKRCLPMHDAKFV